MCYFYTAVYRNQTEAQLVQLLNSQPSHLLVDKVGLQVKLRGHLATLDTGLFQRAQIILSQKLIIKCGEAWKGRYGKKRKGNRGRGLEREKGVGWGTWTDRGLTFSRLIVPETKTSLTSVWAVEQCVLDCHGLSVFLT